MSKEYKFQLGTTFIDHYKKKISTRKEMGIEEYNKALEHSWGKSKTKL
jgi:hypothetical protein